MSGASGTRPSRFDLIVDVRTKLEYWLGHLPDAECVPVTKVGDVLGGRDSLARDCRILVYCASGARSAHATMQLRALGFTNVVDGGGMAAAAAHLDGA